MIATNLHDPADRALAIDPRGFTLRQPHLDGRFAGSRRNIDLALEDDDVGAVFDAGDDAKSRSEINHFGVWSFNGESLGPLGHVGGGLTGFEPDVHVGV